MENSNAMEKGRVSVPDVVYDKTVNCDAAVEVSLADYLPEIKRLLRVQATVMPPEKYVGTTAVELSGTVDYSILYAGNDGALYCASQTGEYQCTVPIESLSSVDVSEGILALVQVNCESATGRVSGPRRVGVKSRLRIRVRLLGSRLLGEGIGSASVGNMQFLQGRAQCRRLFHGIGERLALADEILIDPAHEGLRVVCGEGQVFVTEAMAGSGCVDCRGEVALKLLCVRNEGEAPMAMMRRIPFSQSVAMDGVEVNCDCCATGVCADLSVTVEEGRLLCEVGVLLSARAQRNESAAYVKDAYSDATSEVCTYGTVTLPYAQKCHQGNFSLNRTMTLEEAGMRAGQSVIDLSLSPFVTGVESENGKYVVTGRCRCHVVLASDGDYSAQEFDLPFRYETDGSAEALFEADAFVTAISASARMDGERISVDGELAVSLACSGSGSMAYLDRITFGEQVKREGAAYTVCYPSADDTLWSVGKRYHRPVEALMQENPIAGAPAADSADSLAGIRYLLV